MVSAQELREESKLLLKAGPLTPAVLRLIVGP
jgi:hypothetical protein